MALATFTIPEGANTGTVGITTTAGEHFSCASRLMMAEVVLTSITPGVYIVPATWHGTKVPGEKLALVPTWSS